MPAEQHRQYVTPYETGNRNQTTTWAECIAFYERLSHDFPSVLRWQQIGTSDNGIPMHAGIVTADAQFDRQTLQRQRRPVFFNNNGIHPGEPLVEGDAFGPGGGLVAVAGFVRRAVLAVLFSRHRGRLR